MNLFFALTDKTTVTTAVGGTVREFDVGENGVLSWSPPVPPNGDILYYNVIVTKCIERFNNTNLELSPYGTYTVEVINMHVFFNCPS